MSLIYGVFKTFKYEFYNSTHCTLIRKQSYIYTEFLIVLYLRF